MSFFGFDTSLPRDRGHHSAAPGFSAPSDAFAGLEELEPAKDAIDFEETYQGYGGQLDDSYDDNNDDTFGGVDEPVSQAKVGKDFDFSGQTGDVAQAFEEERMRWAAQHAPSRMEPPRQATKPKRTGYEYIPALEADLEADADLWGLKTNTQPLQQAAPAPAPVPVVAAAARKAMTLEEVEAMMLAQSKKTQATASQGSQLPELVQMQHPFPGFPPGQAPGPPHDQRQQYQQPMQILQRPQQPQQAQVKPKQQQQQQQPAEAYGAHHHPQILQRPRPAQPDSAPQPGPGQGPPSGPRQHQHRQHQGQQHGQPRQILQNPNRLSGHGQPMAQPHGHMRGPSFGGPAPIPPEVFMQMSDADKEKYLADEAKRAKRNHKIHILSKYNGLMTPQDKNFITRIQLQNLLTATGSVDADTPEDMLNEDFYYQVYNQIRGAPRQNPHQPANSFAQTYLFQTGGRYGGGSRRHPRGGDNHMQRMEQQVQRAVEAARAKPKNKQLVIEGSLGKISFSNSKTPKPLVNIKRPVVDTDNKPNTGARRVPGPQGAAAERRATLRSIEKIYSCLMAMEDHSRSVGGQEWRMEMERLNEELWKSLRANEPWNHDSSAMHPFIAILAHPKGKKALPRVFRHVSAEQRTIITTMIILHMDSLDVVHNALTSPLPSQVKEEIELFINAVVPCLYGHVNEAPFSITLGLLGLIMDRGDLRIIVRTKVGLIILTMLVSRAEVLRDQYSNSSASSPDQQNEWRQYTSLYTQLFSALEPLLPHIFPDTNPTSSEDVHVWQFLAAMGVAANAEQQQRLVLGVKDRVMSAVGAARTLPKGGERERRLGEVNLFMAALGLDVDMLA